MQGTKEGTPPPPIKLFCLKYSLATFGPLYLLQPSKVNLSGNLLIRIAASPSQSKYLCLELLYKEGFSFLVEKSAGPMRKRRFN
jgi:hypothetical protein